jgi:hypothetical protein
MFAHSSSPMTQLSQHDDQPDDQPDDLGGLDSTMRAISTDEPSEFEGSIFFNLFASLSVRDAWAAGMQTRGQPAQPLEGSVS